MIAAAFVDHTQNKTDSANGSVFADLARDLTAHRWFATGFQSRSWHSKKFTLIFEADQFLMSIKGRTGQMGESYIFVIQNDPHI